VSDIFDEVSAELRRDRASLAWKRYGRYVIGSGVAIVLLVSAVIGYQSYTQARAEAASARYDELVTVLAETDSFEQREQFVNAFIDAESGGYQALAMMRAGFDAKENGDSETALSLFDELSTRGDLSPALRDLARLQAAVTLLDNDASVEDVESRLARMLVGSNQMRPAAREILALTHLRHDSLLTARTLLVEQLADSISNNLTRQRAGILLDIVNTKLGPNAAPVAQEN
jgi:hypothetical protein